MTNVKYMSDYRRNKVEGYDPKHGMYWENDTPDHMIEREKELINQTRQVDDLDERLEQLIDEMTEE